MKKIKLLKIAFLIFNYNEQQFSRDCKYQAYLTSQFLNFKWKVEERGACCQLGPDSK